MTDTQIIAKLKSGDTGGYSALIDRYAAYVSTIICNFAQGGLPVEDVEELSADVFWGVWKAAERLQTQLPLKPYLAAAARNAAATRLRRRPPAALSLELFDTQDSRAAPDRLAEQQELRLQLSAALDQLGEPDREIFVRRHCFGEQLAGISARLGLPLQTAKTKLRRARQKLQRILNERGYDLEKD